MMIILRFTGLILLLFLIGCSQNHFTFPWAYKMDIQQGNIITQAKVDQLKKGMSKEQVQHIMGRPILTDVLSQNRLHYLYSLQTKNNQYRQSVTLVFTDDRLTEILQSSKKYHKLKN